MGEIIADGTLLRHSVVSLFRVTARFYPAIIFGIPLGIVIGRLMDYVMDGMIVIGLIGLLLDYIMQHLGKIESTNWETMGR